jgi:hypothetical protein
MKRSAPSCPVCGEPLALKSVVPVRPFPCSNCGAQLQESESYVQWTGWGSLLFVAAVFLASGLRGLYLVLAMLLAFYPTLYLDANYLKYIITPKIQIYLPKDATLNLHDTPKATETRERKNRML